MDTQFPPPQDIDISTRKCILPKLETIASTSTTLLSAGLPSTKIPHSLRSIKAAIHESKKQESGTQTKRKQLNNFTYKLVIAMQSA